MTISLTRPSKCGLISILFGLIFLIKALLCVVFYLPIQTFVELVILNHHSLKAVPGLGKGWGPALASKDWDQNCTPPKKIDEKIF